VGIHKRESATMPFERPSLHRNHARLALQSLRVRRISTILAFALVFPIVARAQSAELRPYVSVQAPVVVLRHVRVIDGTGSAASSDQSIVISGDKITAVGDSSRLAVPPDAKILDLAGYTVIPGLVGMHDHLFYPTGGGFAAEMGFSFPRLYLAGGVTTIRTTGSLEPYTDLALKREIDANRMPGPKMHLTGPYLEGEGSSALQMYQLKNAEDTTRVVNFWLDNGFDSLKAYMYITRAELSAAIDAAHKRHLKVTGHLCSIGFREAAALGIDDLEHGLYTDTEFLPDKKPDQCPDLFRQPETMAALDVNSGPLHETILDLVQHHVAITSTLPVYEMLVPGRPPIQQRVLDALSPDARGALLQNKIYVQTNDYILKHYGTEVSPWIAAFKKEMEFEHAFVQAGGFLMAGLDPTGSGGVLAGFGDQREIELLVEAGFTPIEAIHIATENGATFLGEADRIGTIAPGKIADLVVIKGDPSTKIEDIENVETTFKNGVGYDSTKLIASVRAITGRR
jgi:imidazolonepropionase-like amidohydrolase